LRNLDSARLNTPLVSAHTSTRQLIPFAALSAAYFSHIGVINTFIALWLKEIGYGVALIGMIAALQSLSRVVAPYAWAWLGDHTGQGAKLMRWASSLSLAGALGFFWPQGGALWLAGCLLFMYLNNSAMMPMSEAALTQAVTRNGVLDVKRHGRVRLFGSLGFMLTVLGAGAWFEAFGMRHFPWLVALSLIVLVLCSWQIPEHRTVHATEETVQEKTPVAWRKLREPAVAWLFVSIGLHVLSHMGMYVFFSLYCDELGYSKTTIGLLWAVSVIIEIGWFYSQGRWLPFLPLSAWLIVCALAAALRFAVTAGLGEQLWLLFAMQALHAITFAAHHTVCTALLAQHFPDRLRGRGQALYTVLGYGVPGMIGSWAGGLISAAFGLRSVFWIFAGVALLAAGCAIKVWRLHQVALRDATSNH
jgi:MFS transporter, PPP family, 3-phenylpropionic acid transporter